jgi:hypothetical protein
VGDPVPSGGDASGEFSGTGGTSPDSSDEAESFNCSMVLSSVGSVVPNKLASGPLSRSLGAGASSGDPVPSFSTPLASIGIAYSSPGRSVASLPTWASYCG